MIEIKNVKIGPNLPFVLIAGPCVVENEKITFTTAEQIKKITSKLGIPFIFKSSYKKANRTSINSFKGIGDSDAIKILEKVKRELLLKELDKHLANSELTDEDCIRLGRELKERMWKRYKKEGW